MIGKLLYGLLFCVALPSYFLLWSLNLGHATFPPVPPVAYLGYVLTAGGLIFIFNGMSALWFHGHGLPMNAFPPKKFVQQGLFKWISHPIYIGFVSASFGVSLSFGSEAGFWFISPIISLACVALTLGYERPSLLRRFGTKVESPWLRLPPAGHTGPSLRDKISVVALVFVPWLILYELVEFIGPIPPVFSSVLWFEKAAPVWEVWSIPYVLVYLFVFLTPFIARQQDVLRRFANSGLCATTLVLLIYITLPFEAQFREVTTVSSLSVFLQLQQKFDTPITALPAFHIIWLLLSASVYLRSFPKMRVLIWLFVLLASLSCWLTGMHAILDLVAGGVVYAIAWNYALVWSSILKFAEKVANSWKEWRLGSTRVINHGFYAGSAATIGFLIVSYVSSVDAIGACFFIGMCTVLGAGVWGQFLVGSTILQRPFGYYGSVIGAGIGMVLAHFIFDQNVLTIIAALTIAAPLVQAIGRFRCLIQGCCHGAETVSAKGIKYRHERSRVLRVSNMGHRTLHATPVYSIASNLVLFLLIGRLFSIGAPTSVIIGTYLILNGLARFVEEALRGEVQTQLFGGLRVYQWTAIASVILGSVFTMIPSNLIVLENFGISQTGLLLSLVFGVFVMIAMGVDWPNSRRPFSRLI